MIELIKFQPKRTFGVELEFARNAGREGLARIIQGQGEEAVVGHYHHNHNNSEWFCKPDSSCSTEVASRKMGSTSSINTCIQDLMVLERVSDAIFRSGAQVDDRCGMHVHLGIHDYEAEDIDRFLGYWLKFEKLILDMLPGSRVNNRFCPPHSKKVRANTSLTRSELRAYFDNGRTAVNLQHVSRREKIEIRCGDSSTDARNVKNWTRFLLLLAERALTWDQPENYNWYSLVDGLRALRLLSKPGEADLILSPAMSELREWLIARTVAYAKFSDRTKTRMVAEKLHSKLYPSPYGVEEDLSS